MSTPSSALLARYLAGECSTDEIQDIARWAAEDAAHEVRLEELHRLWAARRPQPSWDVAAMWATVQRSMRVERRRDFSFEPPARRRYVGRAAVAAAMLVLVAGGVWLARSREWASRAATAAAPMREYVTGRGRRATLQLPDGTRLVLGPASRLRISPRFGRAAREVWLDGEAVFDVVHDTTKPFRVRSKFAVAQDIGTRFGVRAYPGDTVVTVAVAEGAVALGLADTSTAGAQGIVLGAGGFGSLGGRGQITTGNGPAADDYLRWADGSLVFTDVLLGDVVTRLARWYDVDVRLESPMLAGRRVTARFRDESPLEALQFIALFLDLTVSRAGHRYVLRTK